MLLFDLVFASVLVYVSLGCDIKAPLPKPYPSFNFDKAEGIWYLTVTTKDDMAMDMDCMTVKNIHSTPTGYEDFVTGYYNGKKLSFPVHIKYTNDGYFKQESVEQNEAIASSYYANGNINPKAVAEQHEITWEKYALLGDFRHYFAYVNCTSSGWIIWVFTKEKKVTPEQFVYIHNGLLKHGVSAPLRLGRCESVVEK